MKRFKWLLIVVIPLLITASCRHSGSEKGVKRISSVLQVEETSSTSQNIDETVDTSNSNKVGRPTKISKTIEKGPPVLTWDTLLGLDYETGKIAPEVKKFEGKIVRIPGFAVPIAGENEHEITEALLIPEPMMCLHVPPLPPNQIVHVKFKNPESVDSFVPLLISGTLKIVKTVSEYGEAGYEMEGLNLDPYEMDEGDGDVYEDPWG